MTDFAVIDSATWLLRDRAFGTPLRFAEIVSSIRDQGRVISHVREHAKGRRTLSRVTVTIEVAPELVNLFHNSPAGYRAQYYMDPSLGERANQYMIQCMLPQVLESIGSTLKTGCGPSFVKTSLAGPYSKVWIYQGTWLRHKPKAMRVLYPKRWVSEAARATDERTKKLLTWGCLAPTAEGRLQIKGSYVDLAGAYPDLFKVKRSEEIRRYGFT